MEYKKIKEINEYKSESINPMKTPDTMYELYSVPFFTSGHPEYLYGSEIGSSKVIVQKNDILVCKINPRINRVWVVSDESNYQSIASSEWIVVRNAQYNPYFLAWYFRTPMFQQLMTSEVTGIGGSLTRAQPKRVAEYPVPVLSRERQDKIVSILNRLESIKRERKSELDLLDSLVKARFVELFGNPVLNSKNLPLEKLSNLGELNRGVSKHRPRNAPELLNGAYPLIQTGDVANSDTYITRYSSTYSELGLRQSRLWPKETLCITIAANIAKTGILKFNACFPDSVVGFISGDKVTSLYIHYWFSFFQKILENQAPMSAQKNINLKLLSELNVMVPSLEVQAQFSVFIRQINKSKSVIKKSLDETQILFQSLMQEYFG